MSRVGKEPISIPAGVAVNVKENLVEINGPKGELKRLLPASITVSVVNDQILVQKSGNSKNDNALHGLLRSLVANMVKGVTEGYEKSIEIRGIGFRAEVKDKKLVMNLGYSHTIEIVVPEGITVQVVKKPVAEQLAVTQLILSGIDNQQMGEFAASIRKIRPPEPYKGAGVRDVGEHIRRKAGKKAA